MDLNNTEEITFKITCHKVKREHDTLEEEEAVIITAVSSQSKHTTVCQE
jgi:hypothetical protein